MERISALVQILLLFSIFTINVEQVAASNTIYIRADGSIDPVTANITSADNATYIFTDNNYDGIVIERDNIIVDGAGFNLQGTGSGYGITLSGRSNVTLRNIEIMEFAFGVRLISFSSDNTVSGNNITNNDIGVYLEASSFNTVSGNTITANNDGIGLFLFSSSSNNTVSGNTITNHYYGVNLFYSCSNNTVSENNITNNYEYGVYFASSCSNNTVSGNTITNNDGIGLFLYSSSFNTVSENNITNNGYGVWLNSSSDNTVSGNNINSNTGVGITLSVATDNRLYHNNLIDNPIQVYILQAANIWDNGCEGNYWSDFAGSDSDGDGIGDTPYMIDSGNQDNYPLMNLYWNPGDIDHDLDVDIFDVVAVANAYGSTPSDPNWNCHSDINEPHGKIDIFDIVLLAGSYGEEYSP